MRFAFIKPSSRAYLGDTYQTTCKERTWSFSSHGEDEFLEMPKMAQHLKRGPAQDDPTVLGRSTLKERSLIHAVWNTLSLEYGAFGLWLDSLLVDEPAGFLS